MKITELNRCESAILRFLTSPPAYCKSGIKIKEGDKETCAAFQGVIIRIRKGDAGGSLQLDVSLTVSVSNVPSRWLPVT